MGLQKILVVDDTGINIEILNGLLGDEYDVLSALDGEFALEIARDDKPDLILLDIIMPDMDGFEVCRRLKEDEATRDIPVIFITAKTDENSIEKAYDVGGADYVTKPFRPKELMIRVKKELKLQEVMLELKLMALIDPMTKLYNRRYFSKISKHLLAISKREKSDLSIIMLDIDRFKAVNDKYGHQAGDDAIIALSSKLMTHKREADILCRYGGEEFVMLLPNTSQEGARVVAERIREDIEHSTISLTTGQDLSLTVSIGISKVHTYSSEKLEPYIMEADIALYRAKESGRNRVCIYEQDECSTPVEEKK